MRDLLDRGIGAIQKPLRMPPERFSRGGAATPVSPSLDHAYRSGDDHAIDTFRQVDDDVDAATPVDAQNAPTGGWKSRQEREIPQRPHRSSFSLKKKHEEQNHSDQPSTELDHPQSAH